MGWGGETYQFLLHFLKNLKITMCSSAGVQNFHLEKEIPFIRVSAARIGMGCFSLGLGGCGDLFHQDKDLGTIH